MADEQTKEKGPKWRYRLQLVSERHDHVLFTFSMPIWVTVVLGVLLTLAVAFFALYLVASTPLRQYMPGYLDMNKRAVVVESAMRIDSIARESELRDLYIQNLLDILADRKQSAKAVKDFDEVVAEFSDSILPTSNREMAFRKQYEQQERFGLDAVEEKLSAVSFLNVVKGKVELPEDESEVDAFAGLKLSLEREMPVLSPIESTIISTRYILGEGYEVALQCTNEYVIIITHISSLMASEGQSLKAGAVLGHAGKEKEPGDRWIRIRIWHKGKPIDPTTLMDF